MWSSNWAEAEIPFNKALSRTHPLRGWIGGVFAYKPAPSLHPYTQPVSSRVWGEANSFPMFAIPSNWQQTHNIVKYMSEVLTCPNEGQLHREIHAAAQGLPQESCSALGGLHTGWAVKTAGAPELSPPRCATREWHTKPPQLQIHTADLKNPLRIFHVQGKVWKWGPGKWPLSAPALLYIASIKARGLTLLPKCCPP